MGIRQNLKLSQEIKRKVKYVALLMYITAKIRQGGIRPYFNSLDIFSEYGSKSSMSLELIFSKTNLKYRSTLFHHFNVLNGVRRCGKSVLVTFSTHLYKVWNFLGRNVKIG